MRRSLLLAAGCVILGSRAKRAAQDSSPPSVDSIAVTGNHRLSAAQYIGSSGIVVHPPIYYRDILRVLTALYRTGQLYDVLDEQRNEHNRLILVIQVKERPVLEKWAVRGVERLGEGSVKGRVHLSEGRPLD